MLYKSIIRLQELAEPSIRDAFQSCVQQGANRIIVSPFFLSPGRHWSQVGLNETRTFLKGLISWMVPTFLQICQFGTSF